jgi:hypothetical protein
MFHLPLRLVFALGSTLLTTISIASAQSLVYNYFLVVPLVAETPSYQSTIYIHNASTQTGSVTVTYTGGTGSATPGMTSCPTVQIGANTVLSTSLTALCPGLSPGSNFGALSANYSGCCSYMAMYTRAQTPTGNGFSVEGIQENLYCCGTTLREAIGLTRQAAAPTFQTNCFIWNADQPSRAGRVVVTLLTGDGQLIVDDIVNLQAGEFVRLLDVFASLGAPPGDYSNARATFQSITPIGGGNPVVFVASCTVQNSTSFDADFRLAKYHN